MYKNTIAIFTGQTISEVEHEVNDYLELKSKTHRLIDTKVTPSGQYNREVVVTLVMSELSRPKKKYHSFSRINSFDIDGYLEYWKKNHPNCIYEDAIICSSDALGIVVKIIYTMA